MVDESRPEAFLPMRNKILDALELVYDSRDFMRRNGYTLELRVFELVTVLLWMCLNVNGRPYNVAGILQTVYGRYKSAVDQAHVECFGVPVGPDWMPAAEQPAEVKAYGRDR